MSTLPDLVNDDGLGPASGTEIFFRVRSACGQRQSKAAKTIDSSRETEYNIVENYVVRRCRL